MLDHDVLLRTESVAVREMDRDELIEVIAAVHSKFADRPREEAEAVVRSAYRDLACTATVTSHLIPLTLNRSMRLMQIAQNHQRETDHGEFGVPANSSTQPCG